LISLIALGGAVLCFVNSSEELSDDEVSHFIFLEEQDDKIESKHSGSDFSFVTLMDFNIQNKYLGALHSSEFQPSIFYNSIPRFVIFSALLI